GACELRSRSSARKISNTACSISTPKPQTQPDRSRRLDNVQDTRLIFATPRSPVLRCRVARRLQRGTPGILRIYRSLWSIPGSPDVLKFASFFVALLSSLEIVFIA